MLKISGVDGSATGSYALAAGTSRAYPNRVAVMVPGSVTSFALIVLMLAAVGCTEGDDSAGRDDRAAERAACAAVLDFDRNLPRVIQDGALNQRALETANAALDDAGRSALESGNPDLENRIRAVITAWDALVADRDDAARRTALLEAETPVRELCLELGHYTDSE